MNEAGQKERRYLLLDLPESDYLEIHSLQTDLVRAKRSGDLTDEVVIMVEHPPVFTLGKRGGSDELPVSGELLAKKGICVHHIERGGAITCHGPGQLVLYPILNLRRTGFGIPEFVAALEEVMLRTAAHFGVQARRREVNRGVFAGDNKLGSVGLAIRQGITFHGMALNVGPVPEHFTWVEPCGLKGVAATSIAGELDREVSLTEARKILRNCFEEVFGVGLIAVTRENVAKEEPRSVHHRTVLRGLWKAGTKVVMEAGI